MRFFILAASLIAITTSFSFKASAIDVTRVCSNYADNIKKTEGERYDRSIDICESALDALETMGRLRTNALHSKPNEVLEFTCGIDGQTFVLGDRRNNDWLVNLTVQNMATRGYSIAPSDLRTIKFNFVEGNDRLMYSPSRGKDCSSLLYYLFLVENYFQK
jgi:hypothetical protein